MKHVACLTAILVSSCSMNDDTKFKSNFSKKQPPIVNSGDANVQVEKDNSILQTASTGQTISKSFQVEAIEIDKVIDYMFVLDNSSSMEVALRNATNGIRAALEAGSFKSNSRIGVISTMPADPMRANFDRPHPVIPDVYAPSAPHTLQYDPGFLSFINSADVQFAKENCGNEIQDKYQTPLCENGFFSPYAKHSDGHYCIEAAMQTSFLPLGVEDGILSTLQFFQKPTNRNTFREGAELHVVFISDIHAPGVPNNQRWNAIHQNRPTTDDLIRAAKDNNPVTRVFFHSLAPEQEQVGCTERGGNWDGGKSYFEATDRTGGIKHDICKVDGYSEFIERMIRKSHERDYTIDLEEDVLEVEKVTINGSEAASFELRDGKLLDFRIRTASSDLLNVKVTYKVKQ